MKSAQPFENFIFFLILFFAFYNGMGAFFVKGKYFFVVGALGLGLSCLGLRLALHVSTNKKTNFLP